MTAFATERVLSVRHWNDDYFSFTTTRDDGLRFENGQFVMIGLPVDGRPLMRAYSIASANWEEELEFFSIKVPNGPLTSRLRHLQPGDDLLVSRKPTGTLIKDPEVYERFEKVILTHGVRGVGDLCYHDYIVNELPRHEHLGELISRQLLYYPAVSREAFRHAGRLTALMASGRMQQDLGLPALDASLDRAMICGGPQMLADFRELLDGRGFKPAPRIGTAGEYVFERAFVEK